MSVDIEIGVKGSKVQSGLNKVKGEFARFQGDINRSLNAFKGQSLFSNVLSGFGVGGGFQIAQKLSESVAAGIMSGSEEGWEKARAAAEAYAKYTEERMLKAMSPERRAEYFDNEARLKRAEAAAPRRQFAEGEGNWITRNSGGPIRALVNRMGWFGAEAEDDATTRRQSSYMIADQAEDRAAEIRAQQADLETKLGDLREKNRFEELDLEKQIADVRARRDAAAESADIKEKIRAEELTAQLRGLQDQAEAAAEANRKVEQQAADQLAGVREANRRSVLTPAEALADARQRQRNNEALANYATDPATRDRFLTEAERAKADQLGASRDREAEIRQGLDAMQPDVDALRAIGGGLAGVNYDTNPEMDKQTKLLEEQVALTKRLVDAARGTATDASDTAQFGAGYN